MMLRKEEVLGNVRNKIRINVYLNSETELNKVLYIYKFTTISTIVNANKEIHINYYF